MHVHAELVHAALDPELGSGAGPSGAARHHPADQVNGLDPEKQGVMDMHQLRIHGFDQRRQAGQTVGIRLAQEDPVEMAEPDQHLIRRAADGLQHRPGAAFAMGTGDGGEEQPFGTMAVPQFAEQRPRQDLGAAGL